MSTAGRCGCDAAAVDGAGRPRAPGEYGGAHQSVSGESEACSTGTDIAVCIAVWMDSVNMCTCAECLFVSAVYRVVCTRA